MSRSPGRTFTRDAALKVTGATAAASAGALLLAAAVGIGRFAYTPMLPSMQEVFGWSVSQAGDVASANFLGYMAGALVASVLAQRAGRRRWLQAGMVLSVATTSLGIVAVSLPAWLGIRFLSGVASTLCLVLGTAIVVECLTHLSRPRLGALHFAGVGGGVVISVLIIELARRGGSSVSGQWGALGLTSLLLLSCSWAILSVCPHPPVSSGDRAGKSTDGSTPTPLVLKKLIAAYGLFGFGYVVTATFIVAMARRLDHAALVEPLTWIVVGLLAAPSVLAWQRLAERRGLFSVLRLAYGLEAVGVLLAGYASGHVPVVVGGALLGGTFMGITALGLNAARRLAGNNSDRVIGWMTASFGLGQFLGPAIAGRLAHMTQGFEVPSMVAALLLLLGITLLRDVKH
jgi:predicted MFS family arabinose efflux permease